MTSTSTITNNDCSATTKYIYSNDKIVLMCNYGFRDMTLNLLKCFQKLSISNERFLLYCMDERAYQFFIDKGYPAGTCIIKFSRDEHIGQEIKLDGTNDNNKGVYGEEAESYGNVGFRALCNEKPLVVLDCLKKGYNVLWTDTDIVWLRDPFIHFYHDINHINSFSINDIDLYVQQDDDDICAGFYYIKSNVNTIKFVQDSISFLNPFIDDQISMRLFLKSQGLNIINPLILNNNKDTNLVKYKLLDRKLFPNGTGYFNLKITQRDNTIEQPYIIHNNCIIGHRSKKDRFIEYGLWFINDNDLEISSNNGNEETRAPVKIQFQHVLKNHTDIITSINSLNGILYTTSIDKSIKLWSLNNETNNFKVIKSKFIHRRGGIWSTQILNNNNNNEDINLLTASHDKTIQLWNKEFESVQSFSGHTGIINQLVIGGGNTFFTCSDDDTIIQYSLTNSEFKRVFVGHSDWVSSIALNSNNNSTLYSCSKDGTIRFWDINSGRCLNIIKANQGGWIRKIIYIASTNQLISAGNDGTVKIFNCDLQNSNKEIGGIDNKPIIIVDNIGGINNNSSINDIQYDYDTNILYCAFENGSLVSLNLTNNPNNHKSHTIYQGHSNSSINVIYISKDLNLLFSGGFDKQIKSWKL